MENENQKLGFVDVLETTPGSYNSRIDTLKECTETALIEAVKRALSTGNSAKVTLTITVNRKDDTRIEFDGKVTAKLPESDPGTVTLYHDKKGDLHKKDPRYTHQSLPNIKPLKAVGGAN